MLVSIEPTEICNNAVGNAAERLFSPLLALWGSYPITRRRVEPHQGRLSTRAAADLLESKQNYDRGPR